MPTPKQSSIFTIRGKLYWPRLVTPDTKYDEKGKYSVVVANLDEASLAELDRAGLEHKVRGGGKDDPADWGQYIRLHRKAEKWDGTRNGPPQVVNANAQTVDFLVGNGTVAKVAFRSFDTRGGKGHSLEGVQVLEPVRYERKLFDPVSEVAEEGNPFPTEEAPAD